jgi:class 3 adenylate cyclase
MSDRPTGTVSLLFTDIEGSTRLRETHAGAMRAALRLLHGDPRWQPFVQRLGLGNVENR